MWSGKIKSDLYILDQIVLQLKLISIPVIAIVTLEASTRFSDLSFDRTIFRHQDVVQK